MATQDAIEQAKRLDEIGFPEFTAKMINSTFDALIIANLKQVESYTALVEQVSKTLTVYVNDTKDDIGGEEVLKFLEAVLPAAANEENDSKAFKGAELTSDEAAKLTKAVEVPEEILPPNPDSTPDNPLPPIQPSIPANTALTGSQWTELLNAVAQRIAVNKYTLLQEMVRQGMLRLVVTNGVIECRLTFTTYGLSSYRRDTTDYQRSDTNKRGRSGSGFIFAPFWSSKERTSSTKLTIRTTKETQQDNSGSQVQIFGRVEVNFKTDYQPLS